jgi:hypothetical protein
MRVAVLLHTGRARCKRGFRGHDVGRDIQLEKNRVERALRDLERVRGDRSERLVVVVDVAIEEANPVDLDLRHVVDRDRAAHAIEREGRGEIEQGNPPARDRRPQKHRVQHARELHVRGEPRGAGDFFHGVHTRDALSDDVEVGVFRPGRRIPRRDLDDLGFLAAFDFDFGGDEAFTRHPDSERSEG